MHITSITAYFSHAESLFFIMNRKIPDLEREEENMPKQVVFEPGKYAEGSV